MTQAQIAAEILDDARKTLNADGLTDAEIEAAMPAITEAASWYSEKLERKNAAALENVRSGYMGQGGIFESMYQDMTMPSKIAERLHAACE